MASEIDKSLSAVAKGGSIIFLGFIIGDILGIGHQILLARFLGPASYGLFYLGLSLISIFATLSLFGISAGATRFVSMYSTKKDQNKLKSTVHFGLTFTLLLGSLFAILLFFTSKYIASFFNKPDLGFVLQIFAIALPFIVLTNILISITRGKKEPKYRVYAQNIGIRLINIPLFLIFIYLGFLLKGALIAHLLSAIGIFCFLLIIVQKKVFKIFNNTAKRVPVAKVILSYSWPLTLSSFVVLAMGHADRIILGIYTISENIGIYTASYRIAYLLNFIPLSLGFIFFPVVTDLFAKKDYESINKVYSSITKWAFMIAFPLSLVMIAFPEFLISLFFGKEYVLGKFVLAILSVGILVGISAGLVGLILNAIGKTKLTLAADSTGSIVNVGLNLILIPIYGIIGAAIATSFSLILRNIIALFFVKREIKIIPYNKSFLKIGLLCVVGLIAAFFSALYINENIAGMINLFFISIPISELFLLLIIIAYIIICYFAYIKLRFIDEYDKFILRKIRNRIPIGKGLIEKIL